MSSGDFKGFDASLILGSNGGRGKILEVLQRGVEGAKSFRRILRWGRKISDH